MLNKFYDKFLFTNTIKFKNYNFFILNIPFIIFPVTLFDELSLSEDSEFNKKFYELIKKSTFNYFMNLFKKEFGLTEQKIIDFTEFYFTASGFGKFKNIDLNLEKHKAIVSLESNVFTKNVKFKAKKPVDHLIRGLLAGLFSYVFKVDVDCVETKCSAMASNECVFNIQEKNAFDFSEKTIREQLKV